MQHASLSRDDNLFGMATLAEINHLLSRTNFIGEHADGSCAFGMGDDGGIRILPADLQDAAVSELHVGITITAPEFHRATGLFHNPSAEIFIGNEEEIAILG